MRNWAIIIPEAITNLVTNPSVELAATGYTAMAGSAARSSTYQRRGVYSLAVTPAAGTSDGVYFGTVSLTTGTTYTFSLDFLGVAGVPYKIYFADTSATLKGTAYTFTATGAWQRVQVTWACDSTTTYRLYATKNVHASTGVFYIDGLMCAQQATAADVHTYVDGSIDGCKWNGLVHASTSSRLATTRTGGREANLADLGLYPIAVTGIGMPPRTSYLEQTPFLPGALFRGSRTNERTIQLALAAIGETRPGLHSYRKDLIDLIKPDAKPGEQEFIMRYYGASGSVPAEVRVRYDDGAGFDQPFANTERIALRLLATDPYWYEDGDQGISLTTQQSFTMAYIGQRIDGVWGAMGSGLNGIARAMAIGPDGCLYVGGDFTAAGGVADTAHVAKWNGTAWSALATGLDGVVRCLAFGADGSLYAGGDFTGYISNWDGSSWTTITNLFNGVVYSIAIGLDGIVYAGGAFDNYAAFTAANHIAQWDGSLWTPLGTGADIGTNDEVYTLTVGPDGTLYVGGKFTKVANTTIDAGRVAKWDGTAWAALGTGMNDKVQALVVGLGGRLYAGGEFTTADGIAAAYVAYWNGAIWSQVGDGLGSDVTEMAVNPDNGLIVADGIFTPAHGIDNRYIAMWNGSVWTHFDMEYTTSQSILYEGERLYVSNLSSKTVYSSVQTTVTNNGTVTAYPIIKIKRSGGTLASVRYLKNETTGATIWLSYDLADGETLTIDLRPGKRKVTSDWRGNAWQAILRASDVAEFSLLPGNNLVNMFVYTEGSPTITTTMEWRKVHWSSDGVAT